MPRIFNYIDASPGAGKTEYFVNKAVKHLEGPSKQILVYVAPTIQLLSEALRRVHARTKFPPHKVHLVVDKGVGCSKLDLTDIPRTDLRIPADQATVAVNYLLGLIPEDEYKDLKQRNGYRRSCVRPLQDGDVLFTTHETFLRVRMRDASPNPFQILKKCHVVFDEARNCVAHTRSVQMKGKQWLNFLNSIETETHARVTTKGQPSWHVMKIINVPKLATLKRVFKVTTTDQLPETARVIHRDFTKFAKDGRAALYITGTDVANLTDRKNPKVTLYAIIRPVTLFEHYGRVTLTSAFFKDSQMYHFLKADGHSFNSLLDGDDPDVAVIRKRDLLLKSKVSKRLRVAPLIASPALSSNTRFRSSLTTTLLQSGLLVPITYRPKPGTEAAAAALSRMASGELYPSEQALSQHIAPPIWVLIREAAKVFAMWQKNYPESDVALLTLNKDRGQKWEPSGVNHMGVVRTIANYGRLQASKGIGGFSSTTHPDSALTSESWVSFLRNTLWCESKTGIFHLTSSPVLYGVNTFSRLQAFVHLSALNPAPDLIRLYEVLLPSYNIDLDHSIDNLMQMLYRTNLRDPKGTSKILLITPYETSAQLMARKLGVEEFSIIRPPKLKVWDYTKERDDDEFTQTRSRGGKAKRKYTEEGALEVVRVRARLHAAKKVDASHSTPDSRKKIKQLEALLASIMDSARIK